ncbi:solute carrier family 43 member 3-like [Oncorhynchus kisutch]|uniref:solute carrier family 43 member 3-like n=1 Tax=Oncorhynchus kisutch TaxID=8019 RepID=UPI0012DBF83D|nr:solute carrier family 43 member 3-like [Oncorhynchus kisutch]XP_031670539.1 solute carrier family 43 member 3-like [Oncorhynchus kisutch]XP_031670540.1 solute carrier family 43 member 3-like [Oncorhynchus kisutch]XP_031670542.1 solute carrier family 43 member 3-like [Oncorhynchus kisutch]
MPPTPVTLSRCQGSGPVITSYRQTVVSRMNSSLWSSPSPPSPRTSCVSLWASCSTASAPWRPGSGHFLYERGVSFHSSFLVLSVCSVIHVFRTFFLMPKTHIPYPLPDRYAYGVSCGGRRWERGGERGEKDGGGGERKGDVNAKYQKNAVLQKVESAPLQLQDKAGPSRPDQPERVTSFRSCVLSWFFLWHLVWVAVMQFCHFLFIATVNPIYVNVGLTLLTLLTFIHTLHVHLHCRSLASQRRATAEEEVTNSGSKVTCNRLVGM